jgi:hypothetical protein
MLIFEGREHDLGGGLKVHRILPFAKKRMVGPFIFLDHMGPVVAQAGQNTDVRPHPHIGLSTLTYLFEGRMVHRDSLGEVATIVPGQVNWMTAGRGIVHSERAHPDDKQRAHALHGLQFWVALPDGNEEIEPSFQHQESVPRRDFGHYSVCVAAGQGFGLSSGVRVHSPLIFAEFRCAQAGEIDLGEFPGFERGLYLVDGELKCAGESINKNHMAVLDDDVKSVQATEGAHFVLIGGEAFTTPRHIWWNLVSSSKERIEQAKKQWAEGGFAAVPGETEFIPLPNS